MVRLYLNPRKCAAFSLRAIPPHYSKRQIDPHAGVQSPLCSTSGKLPPPIIGDVRRCAKLHTTMAVFGFKAHASTKNSRGAFVPRAFFMRLYPKNPRKLRSDLLCLRAFITLCFSQIQEFKTFFFKQGLFRMDPIFTPPIQHQHPTECRKNENRHGHRQRSQNRPWKLGNNLRAEIQ